MGPSAALVILLCVGSGLAFFLVCVRWVSEIRASIDRMRGDMTLAVTDRFAEAQRAQMTALLESRTAEDHRFERFETTLRGVTTSMSGALGDLKASLAETSRSGLEVHTRAANELREALVGTVLDVSKQLSSSQAEARRELAAALERQERSVDHLREAQTRCLDEARTSLTKSLDELRSAELLAFAQLQERVALGLDEMRKDNALQLEKVRATVDEKLQTTLEARLGDSFRLVSDRLEQLHKGLGEVQALASGVGDLKKVLSNVRARGTFGEVQLETLLEQVLTPDQYAKNVATVPGSSERVEFAVKLPGRGGASDVMYLPIDAKFPLEDYERLQRAFEESDAPAAEEARKALRVRILHEAQTIREKYVAPPHTTDLALLFLPTEGLYAEVLRIPALSEDLQTKHRIVPVGPTTLFAVLTSLQMGFRTLAIERRSSEVWAVLGAVKTEFGKFGESLDAVRKKILEAGNKIEDATRRTRVMARRLGDVEALPDGQSSALLFGGDVSEPTA